MRKSLLASALSSVLLSSLIAPAFAVTPKPGEVLAKEQVFRMNMGSAPRSLDPSMFSDSPSLRVVRNIFEALVTYDNDGKPRPGVAEKYTHSADFKTWTFHLRKDAKWSNGDPVTAHDFVYSWRRLADPKTASDYASFLEYMKVKNAEEVIAGKRPVKDLGVKALDDSTFEVKLSSPVGFFDYMAGFAILSPIPQKVVEKYGDKWTQTENIVVNGAWLVAENTLHEKIVLKRNPGYWDSKNVVLEKVVMYQLTSLNTSFDRYRAGDIDVTSYPPELLEKVNREYADELTDLVPSLATFYFLLNTRVKPFDDVRVRQALSLALDRDIIAYKLLRVGDVPAYSFTPSVISSGEKIVNPEWASWSMEKRSQKARELLKEAGYTKSTPLKFTMLYSTNELGKKLAVSTLSIWKKSLDGAIDMTIKNLEWKTFLEERSRRNFQLVQTVWGADYDDASTFLNIFKSNSSNNQAGYQNKDYDNFIDKGYAAKTPEERQQFYAKAEELLQKETPIIPITHSTSKSLIKKYVRGLKPNKNSRTYFKDLYILKH